MSLQSIKYKRGSLEILDQLLLPVVSKYVTVKGVEDGWKVINKMQVSHPSPVTKLLNQLININQIPIEIPTFLDIYTSILVTCLSINNVIKFAYKLHQE